MGEWNPLEFDEFAWDVLKMYIKHGYGEAKLYGTTFFSCHMSETTVLMTLDEIYEHAVNHEGKLWREISPLAD